jgi:hypothetical protein
MTAKRVLPPGAQPPPSLPHDHDREGGQPYAKEVEDYKGGVASPPEESAGEKPILEPQKRRRTHNARR